MKKHWRNLLSLTPETVQRTVYNRYFRKHHTSWLKHGKQLPVSHFSKQEVLISLAQQFKLTTLVETGTYLGDTLFALYPHFDTLYSIELSPFYFQKAQKRFKRFGKINLRLGDSAVEMSVLLKQISQPALFWLDGHYSGGKTAKGEKECPVYDELTPILSSGLQHVVVIDDARLFVGANDYPTVDELRIFVKKHKPGYRFVVQNDSIRLLPTV